MTETVTDEQRWLNTAADCERIAAQAEAEHDPERARRWRKNADEARENARRVAEGRTDLIR